MRVQHTDNAACMSVLKAYGNKAAAVLLMTSRDAEMAIGLKRVFELHEAPFLHLEDDLDWDLDSVGDCVIKDGGLKIIIEGCGSSFMGMVFETNWTEVDQEWREAAEFNGCAWVALVDPPVYERALVSGSDFSLPIAVQVIRLDVIS